LAFRIPQSLKRAGRTGKHLLRALASRRLPRELIRLPKRGFTAPVGQWIAGEHRNQFESEVLKSGFGCAGMIDVRAARRLFAEHIAGNADHSYALWALWILQRWHSAQRRRHISESDKAQLSREYSLELSGRHP